MRKPYSVRLQADIFDTYRCQRAANSLDIDVAKKSVHTLDITADLDSSFNIGLILGASGSGKTTLAKMIYGDDCFQEFLDLSKPVIEQFPKELSYDECAEILSGVGLTSVPCWIRPASTLSNGQRARAEIALAIYLSRRDVIVIDEWTSVVDRTVAKVMSHCIQKFARKNNKKILLLSCHYDVTDWLMPDFVIDCNTQEYIEFRGLPRQRTENIIFEIRSVGRESWKYFSKYHYLSDKLPAGKIFCYGIFHGENQIGFQCFANYVPKVKGKKLMFHSNRTVIHPDYAGFGLGIKLINETSKEMASMGYDVRGTFSSIPIYKSLIKSDLWEYLGCKTNVGMAPEKRRKDSDETTFARIKSPTAFRSNVKMFSFKFKGC